MIMQTTIKFPMSCYGFGIHSGRPVQLTIKPAKQDQGIVFIRTDVNGIDNIVQANYANVCETMLATTICNGSGVKVATIEHFMAAVWSSGIDNMIVELDGPEIPIMDGSSRPFMFMLACGVVTNLNKKKKRIKILKEVFIQNDDAYISVEPNNTFAIQASIEFASKAIGKQSMLFDQNVNFKDEICAARTFGFVNELKYLNSKGLGLGANLDNAVGIDENDELVSKLRFENEFIRHKILDAIGDFATAGLINAHFRSHKSGHNLNNQILHKIFSNSNNYTFVS